MQTNFLPALVDTQVSEYVKKTYPLFSEFLKVYYEYASKKFNAYDIIINHKKNNDIDFADEETLDKFYKTYGEYLPKEIAFDKQNLIKMLNSVYESKGSVDSLKLLFKLIFNETAEVFYPSSQILRASDGKWEQDVFVTLMKVSGSLPKINDIMRIEYGNTYDNKITKVEELDSTRIRLYFRPYNKITFTENQVVYVINKEANVIYTGKVVKSAAKLIIKYPGQAWQKGQIIIIPGTIKDTVARVSNINTTGGITAIEIIDYGYDHLDNQTTTISPYPNKPANSSVNINYVDAGNHIDYTIDILDFTEGTEESVVGLSSGFSIDSYFLENYVSGDYIYSLIFSSESRSVPTIASNLDSSLTMEKWLTSRATFSYEFDTSVKTRGFFKDDSGQLSNEVVRLQDNYFYQPFSYVIETQKDIKDYKQLANIYHPAGTKGFSTLSKITSYEFAYSSTRTLSIDTIRVRDEASADDSTYMSVNKILDETTAISESISNMLNKYIVGDAVTVSHGETYVVDNATVSYATDYFSEAYTINQILLTIG